jgi:hypothetical protein
MSNIIAKGTATVLKGATSVVVPHGLTSTPSVSDILLEPQDDLQGIGYWPSNPTSTTFQINLMSQSMADHVFSWYIVGVAAAVPPTPPSPPGAFPITAADAQAFLGATYDATNKVYSVYGLNIADTTFQAHVMFANNYILSILGSSIGSTDPKYQTAYLAALEVAVIRILVVSMGGSLVGAFDYFLGDLRVARAGPYKEAITATLQGIREDLNRQLVNLTPVAVSFDVASKGEVPTYRGALTSP